MWLIAKHEYKRNIRKRSFLLSAFLVPVISIGVMVLSVSLTEEQFTSSGGLGEIGYVDTASPPLTQLPESAQAVEPPENYVMYESVAGAEAAFEAEDVGAYFVIRRDYWDTGMVEFYATKKVPEGVKTSLHGYLRALVAAHGPAAYAERLSDPMELSLRTIGGTLELSDETMGMAFIIPYIFAMLFMMATTVTSQFLMLGVVEEKESRVMEILVTSSTPEQLMAGKVFGLGGLALTQLGVWAVAGVAISVFSGPDSAVADLLKLPPGFLLVMVIYFLLGFIFMSSLMAGIGASVTAEQEGRQLAQLISMLFVVPVIVGVMFIFDPNGTVPVILSLIPFTAPVSMMMRLPIAAVPLWQILLSIALLILATVVAVWVSARVFRLGMLMYGKRLRLRDMLSVFRRGAPRQVVLTAANGESE
jgi:ABC-2 type transport system permease protein